MTPFRTLVLIALLLCAAVAVEPYYTLLVVIAVALCVAIDCALGWTIRKYRSRK